MGSKERSASRPHYYGAADFNLLVAWRFAPHNHADQADIGRQRLRRFRPRGLSAAPLGGAYEDYRSERFQTRPLA